jgi:hypothetical protein
VDENEEDHIIDLYEMGLDGSKTYITKTDIWGCSFELNADFSCIAFTLDGDMYVMHREGSGWGGRSLVCENAPDGVFDRSGRYLYYVRSAGEDMDY